MDALDRRIINELQGGFPLSERPYAEAAERLGTSEDVLLRRLDALLADGTLSRFGPMFHAERMGGAFSLVAMQVPAQRFEEVAALVNAHPEVAHNYAREHDFNMWFVLATETPGQIDTTLAAIEQETGLKAYNMPKHEEYYIGLRFKA